MLHLPLCLQRIYYDCFKSLHNSSGHWPTLRAMGLRTLMPADSSPAPASRLCSLCPSLPPSLWPFLHPHVSCSSPGLSLQFLHPRGSAPACAQGGSWSIPPPASAPFTCFRGPPCAQHSAVHLVMFPVPCWTERDGRQRHGLVHLSSPLPRLDSGEAIRTPRVLSDVGFRNVLVAFGTGPATRR